MCILSNFDFFEDLFNAIKESDSINDVIKEYGGSSIYIPSYKSIYLHDDIRKKYLEYKENNTQGAVKKLSREFGISERQIYSITKELREGGS